MRMSEVQYYDDCDKCWCRETVVVVEDDAPIDVRQTDCMNCGWRVQHIEGHLDRNELAKTRDMHGYDPDTHSFR